MINHRFTCNISFQFTMIWNWLPARLTLCQPDLVFTTETDGFRLQTLLERIANADYSILVVKSTRGEVSVFPRSIKNRNKR